MKVKIGDKIYDGDEQPIMIILEDYDKVLISAMSNDNSKYCRFPDGSNIDDIKKFMEVEN